MSVKKAVLSMVMSCWGLLPAAALPTIEEKTTGMDRFEGFFDWYWDGREGKIWLEVDAFDTEVLMVHGLAAGVGSNDIGLDRTQLGSERVVEFRRIGPKILLVQPNLQFRAEATSNPQENRSVRDGFAESVLWGFEVGAENAGIVLVDLTPLLLSDQVGISERLDSLGEGQFTLDDSRSALYLSNCRSFPDNAEFEATLTFRGKKPGRELRSVTPTPELVSIRQHLSFIRLPGTGYRPRPYHVLSGYFPFSYRDYAIPIGEDLTRRYITRHRLQKKDPSARLSEPVEPIIYYLDPATPEPVRTALLEGARWWGEAFRQIGFRDAFRVEMLPLEADPMDVRYNVINWLHRSTRGWSYGASITDPRTGEILKGHVNLGSLRVRQDYLIAEGLLSPYREGVPSDDPMLAMALARLRQLSAHEVGHTLGLSHNFAGSTNGRASVMDYPHPLIRLRPDGSIDLSDAYATGIGTWDQMAIAYGYQDFPDGADESQELEAILEAGYRGQSLRYLSDGDARPPGGLHPRAHLWDNQEDPVVELENLLGVRRAALEGFSPDAIRKGAPLATLHEALVPVYFLHRYQVTAVAKLVGGLEYGYSVRGAEAAPPFILSADEQQRALDALLGTLAAESVAVPELIMERIPPRPPGYPPHRELIRGRTGLSFDPLAAAEAWAQHVTGLLLHPERASRLVEYASRDSRYLSLTDVIDGLLAHTWLAPRDDGYLGEVQRTVEFVVLQGLLTLAGDLEAGAGVRACAHDGIQKVREALHERSLQDLEGPQVIFEGYAAFLIEQYLARPEQFLRARLVGPPPGDPIGFESCSQDESP